MRDWRKQLFFSSVGKVILQRGSRNIPLHVLMPETVIERKGYYYGSQLQGGFLHQLLAKERNFKRKRQMKNNYHKSCSKILSLLMLPKYFLKLFAKILHHSAKIIWHLCYKQTSNANNSLNKYTTNCLLFMFKIFVPAERPIVFVPLLPLYMQCVQKPVPAVQLEWANFSSLSDFCKWAGG